MSSPAQAGFLRHSYFTRKAEEGWLRWKEGWDGMDHRAAGYLDKLGDTRAFEAALEEAGGSRVANAVLRIDGKAINLPRPLQQQPWSIRVPVRVTTEGLGRRGRTGRLHV